MRLRDLVVVAMLLASCRRDSDEIDRAIARRPTQSGIPPTAVGMGTDEATGKPVGYPPELPLVPGFRAVSGGVDPGVVRTATLVYDGMTVTQYRDALAAAMEAAGQRISSDVETTTGSRQLRLVMGADRASAIVSDEVGRVRVDFMMMERRPSPQ